MPSDASEEDRVNVEFEALLLRAGLTVPEDRRGGLLNGYRELRRMVKLLRQGLTPDSAPAARFDPLDAARGR